MQEKEKEKGKKKPKKKQKQKHPNCGNHFFHMQNFSGNGNHVKLNVNLRSEVSSWLHRVSRVYFNYTASDYRKLECKFVISVAKQAQIHG